VKPYNPADWLIVSSQAPSDRLVAAMERVFGKNDPRVGEYANPTMLNELFTWVGIENPDPLKVFVRCYGIGKGEASTPHTFRAAAAAVGRTLQTMQEANVPLKLGVAYQMHHQVPEGHGLNELRAMGLPPRIWTRLAWSGILTLDQLCGRTRAGLYDIRHTGEGSCDLIERLLPEGRSLRR
jgi:hypothetical protein